MEPVDVVVVGAGLRGRHTYGAYAREHPEQLRVVALAEPDPERRDAMAQEHALPKEACFDSWPELLAGPQRAPAAVVATGDDLHVAPALAALAAGYHVLLEKPMARSPEECARLVQRAERAGRVLQVGHVLRFTPFYARIAELVDSGVLGRLVHLDLREHVAAWHMTHSYVRGKFRSSNDSAPILLAKSCHDLDLLVWLAGSPTARVSCFGGRSHFRQQGAPVDAPLRCTDGCPVQAECPHDAEAFYLGPEPEIARAWPWSDVSSDPSRQARRHALERGLYGRCVYHCDNDALDHQLVALELENGSTASFALHGFAAEERRTLRVSGTRGELRGVFQEGVLEWSRTGRLGFQQARISGSPLGHFGGDAGLVAHFVDAVRGGDPAAVRASGRSALESHWIGFAAERARRTGRVVEMAAFRREASETALATAPG